MGHAFVFFAIEISAAFLFECLADLLPVGDADIGGVGSGEEEFLSVVAFGLEAAEFGGAFVEQAMGLGAGAVDGALDFSARGRGIPWDR